MGTKVQDDNEKILAAMVGRKAAAAARRRTPKERATSAPTPEEIVAQAVKDGIDPTGGAIQVNADAGLQGARPLSGTVQAPDGYEDNPGHDPEITKRNKARLHKAVAVVETQEGVQLMTTDEAKAVETAKVKTVRVLEDPVENARLVRMRAKWTYERRERDLARLEEAIESAATPQERRKVSQEMKTAKSVLEEARVNERKAYKAYKELLDQRHAEKAQAKAAKTASPVAEVA